MEYDILSWITEKKYSLFLPALFTITIFIFYWSFCRCKIKNNLSIKQNNIKKFHIRMHSFTFFNLFINAYYIFCKNILIIFGFLTILIIPDGYVSSESRMGFWIVIGIWGILNLINVAFAYKAFYNKKGKVDIKILFFPMIIAVVLFFIFSASSDKFYKRILYPMRFVEIPINSSWYLLNNKAHSANRNSFGEMDGLNLEKIKKNFYCVKRENCSEIAQQQKNALYGYMAWNLGEVKVFCPADVDFGNTPKQNALNTKKCLVINGSFLRILDEQYIKR